MQGAGCGVWGAGCRAKGAGFRVCGTRMARVWRSKPKTLFPAPLRVCTYRRDWGLGFGVWSSLLHSRQRGR